MRVPLLWAHLALVAAHRVPAAAWPGALQPQLAIRPRRAAAVSLSAEAVDATPTTVATGSADAAGAASAMVRVPYFISGNARPTWRGAFMGWLHRTRLWYAWSAVYLVLARCLAPAGAPLGAGAMLIRVLLAAAFSANVLISDGYHNPDRRGGDALSADAELVWLRCDYIGISAVLSANYLLWASNLRWTNGLGLGGAASAAATALVTLLSATVVPRQAGHLAVKVIMGLQFSVLLTYLVRPRARPPARVPPAPAGARRRRRPPPPPSRPVCARARSQVGLMLWSNGFVANALIFALYAPGLVFYVLKKPKSDRFGFHEYFHASVLLGHMSSMLLDLREVVICAIRVAGGPPLLL